MLSKLFAMPFPPIYEDYLVYYYQRGGGGGGGVLGQF